MPDKKTEPKAEDANKEIQEVLEKHGMELVPELSFPRYRELPDEVKLAVMVIMKHEPGFTVVLRPKKQD